MINFYYSSKYILILSILFTSFLSFSQATIKVTVTSVQTANNVDCDGDIIFLPPNFSDFVWEYTATDNTLGYSNNNPALFGIFNFNYTNINNNNGPYNTTVNNLFFDRQYICPSDVPSTINLAWEAYENDDAGSYDVLGITDVETGIQNVSMAVPGSTGTANYNFTAVGSGGGCTQTYTIYLTVERIDFVPTVIILPDDICSATLMNMNTSYNVALCQSNTLQPNEPRSGDIQSNNSSAWFRFVAPASGSVEVSTDNGGTEIGTYFQIYHAADGSSCNTGLQPLTGAVIKDKFEYLSHIEFSDGIDALGLDPEAQISLNACDPVSLISYQKLIAGETYYVQLTSDGVTSGLVEVRINDLGGGPAGDTEDIPCLSSPVAYGQNPISSAATSPESVVLDFGCAYDGGNDYAETGAAHTDNNPIHYHAYDYDHNNVSINNPVVNESVWLNFVAPNSGRIILESDYQSAIYGENNALFGYDKRFSPGVPTDYSCANLEFLAADAGGTNSILGGGDISAIIDQRCLEPGYTYYGMVDPSDNLFPFNDQFIKSWVFDPSISDPNFNSPGNDILCLTLQNPLYEVPVILAGTNPTFQAVAGSNVFACQEYLAGEPNINATPANCANQTVWHYFTAPPSGAVEMSIRAYIGMNTLRYNVYQLFNGTDCYGGLQPATYTEDGTRNTPIITPVLTGTAGFNGTQNAACCLIPGQLYAIQIDGGSAGDEGQYIIEYIQEIDSDAGDIYVGLANGDSLTLAQQDTAFVCFGESIIAGITVNGIGESTQSLPDCLSPGYVIHQVQTVADPIANSGFESAYLDSVIGTTATFTNDGDGSGSFGNPSFNTLYYISPAGDITADWGDFTCGTSTVSNGLPIVFLQQLNAVFNYDNASCTATFSASGGLNGYYSNPYSFTITSPSGTIVANGTLAPGVSSSYTGSEAGIYTVEINDGACPQSFTFDATNCNNPCTPTTVNVDVAICQGESILLGGAQQTESGIYTDIFITAQGCDSTVITNLSINAVYQVSKEHDLCPGGSILIGSNSYSDQGVYVDTLQSVTGCDSIVTSIIFMLPTITSSIEATICSGSTYDFNGTILGDEGVYLDTLATLDGCDSVIILSLFITPPTVNYEVAEICQGENFVFGNLTLNTSGIYTDTVQTASGCDSLNILELSVVDCEFQISNILTPNDDGQNDTWKVSDVSKIAGCDVNIYNRWGELVFETNDYNNQWAGTRNNEQLPDGVYFYSIKCSNSDEYTGEINLLRFKK
jgi:gliding motility-associated-like protein